MNIALKARYLFPVDSPPIPDGVLTVADGRIVAIGRDASGKSVRDLGNVALLPGLVNAHTHLEFSDLQAPIRPPGIAFPDWIAAIVTRRRAQFAQADWPQHRQQAVERGLREVEQTGTVAVGEIAPPGWPEAAFRASRLDCTVFFEVLGLAHDRVESLLTAAGEHLASAAAQTKWLAGVSPHAPYTVHPELLARLCPLCRQRQVPLAMHLAETREELELLQSGTGPLVPMLQSFNAWDPDAIPRGTRPLDYLRVLAQAHRALVIHGNYLRPDEIAFLAARTARMSVVYCPRTHAYFEHEPYPLPSLVSAGVNVAIGTDSRASNPDLSLWEELRDVHRRFGGIALANILRMGTINGATALGREADFGSLAPGKIARLAIAPLPDHDAGDPYELIFGTPGLTKFDGRSADW